MFDPETQREQIFADWPAQVVEPAYDTLLREGGSLLKEAAEIENDPERGLDRAIDIYRDARKKFMDAVFESPDEQTDPWLLVNVGSCLTREAVYAEAHRLPRSDVRRLKATAARTIKRAEDRIMGNPQISTKDKTLGAIVVADALFQANNQTGTMNSRDEAQAVAELARDYAESEKEDTQSFVIERFKKANTTFPIEAIQQLGTEALKEVAEMPLAMAA